MSLDPDSPTSFRDPRDHLRTLLDSITVGIYCVDLRGECTYCNACCLRLLRYDEPAELMGVKMHDLIHHTRRDGTRCEFRDCKVCNSAGNHRSLHTETETFFRKDGSRFDAEAWCDPLRSNGIVVGTVVRFVDFSLRREEAVYRNHLARLVESSHDAIFSKDINGVITTWNQGAQRLFGYEPEEAIGRTTAELILIADSEDEKIQHALANGIELQQIEVKRRRKDGEILDISLTVSPILNRVGEHIGSSFIQRDVTERRRSRDELLTAKKAAEHAETLANVANRSRTEFLAAVSHELRTPMNAILGMLRLALGENLDSTVAEYLKTAKASANSLLELVNDILDFSKLESGKFEINHSLMNVREIVDGAAKSLSPRASEKGLEILCEIDDRFPATLVGDGLRIQQVMTNLLSNAIKFTDAGEIVVKIELLQELPDDVRLEFAVADTGIGIHLQDRERIFAPFAQADMSLTRQHQGTGLGLSICRQLLSLMGGSLKLESEVGRGSRFSFVLTLPIAEHAAPVDDVPTELMKNLRVLIVDDNATNLRILERIFVSWSMQPVVAESADQALRILAQNDDADHEIALAIVDAMMPGQDGFAFARKLADCQSAVKLPVVIMQSATDMALFAENKLTDTVASYITKPVSQSELLDTVIETLGLYGQVSTKKLDSSLTRTSLPRPLCILVAEDLPANQKLVTAILEKRGHQVTIAGNGEAAVDQLANRPETFDVVLMDVQMPVMDGLQATAAIRGLDDKQRSKIPIIAMTAHAMQGDRESCLAAGMDAYIAKPFDAVRLLNLVEAIVHRPASVRENSQSASSLDAESANRPTKTEQALKLVELEAAVSRLGGDQQLFLEFVNIFLEDAPILHAKIKSAVANSNGKQLEQAAHSLKGLMSNFGAKPCVELAQEFEKAGRDNRIETVADRQDELTILYEQLREELLAFAS